MTTFRVHYDLFDPEDNPSPERRVAVVAAPNPGAARAAATRNAARLWPRGRIFIKTVKVERCKS